MVKIEKTPCFGQPNCYKLSNGTVEAIVTSDIGPRIMAYRFAGGDNILGEIGPSDTVHTELGDWHPWGGHRLWHAPEAKPRSYYPDNTPVTAEMGDDGILLVQPVEPPTGIEKQMLVKLDASGTHVSITHRLTNKGLWPVELAPWALTIMNGGGTTILPNEPFIPHTARLLPARPLVLWHYTDFSDPRWSLGRKYIRLKCDPAHERPQKIGIANKREWAAYLRNDLLFVKQAPYIQGAVYPDYGCNFETYTAGSFMEVETLGPMVKLEPEQSTDHVENWHLFHGVIADDDEECLEAAIMHHVNGTLGG